jgi:DNA-binding LytR/AlgR family response regulator
MKYSILIIDDEPLARTLLTDYVGKIPQLELAGASATAMDALDVILHEKVDILLTDIQMPGMTGIELVKMIDRIPAVIFTTAYSEYAVEGFELSALDYLLKPVSFSRFVQAIHKAIDMIDTKLKASMSAHDLSATDTKDYISIKADHKMYKINFEDLIYIEGQSEYVTFHTKHRNITAYYALKNLELELPENHFIRVHKSYIVSIKHIEYVETHQLSVAGNRIPVGGIYRDRVMKLLN